MAYCDRCERPFPNDRALEQHKDDSRSHWLCTGCHLDFDSSDARRQHYIQSPKHHFCRECDRHFTSNESRVHHMDTDHWYCRIHDKTFKSNASLQSHYVQSPDHKAFSGQAGRQAPVSDMPTSCTDCKCSFHSESNLRHHLNSKVHQTANVRCPGRGCNKAFVSNAALVLHFESGTCPSRMTREGLNRIIVRADTNNYITNPARLLTGPLGRSEPPGPAVMWATELSFNGIAYECFLCHSTFTTLARLNQLLQSPRHEDKIYRCPKTDCQTEFVTLSGLCQHVEGGSCEIRMFRQVRDVMDGLTRGFNTLTM